jgi:hypothetical protein
MTFPQTPPGDLVAAYRDAVKNAGDPSCPSCKLISHKLGGAEHDVTSLKTEVEMLRDTVQALEARIAVVTGATATVNQQAFIRKITDQEAAARRSMHFQQKDIGALVDERDDLRKACERAGVSTLHVRQHFVGARLCCSHGAHDGICNALLPAESAWAAPGNCLCNGTVES